MSSRRKTKFVHEGQYVAEISVEIVESESGWSPTISPEDAYKLDDVKTALRAGNIKVAAQYGRVYELRPVISK